MHRSFRLVALLLCGSGLSSLVYQTTWQRMFRLTFALWPAGEPANDLIESWVLGSIQAIKGDDAALEQADRLQQAGFVAEGLLVRARLAEAHNDYDASIDSLSMVPRRPWLISRSTRVGRGVAGLPCALLESDRRA